MQIFEFGTAPHAKALGYRLVGTLQSTLQKLKGEFDTADLIFVTGAAIHGQPGVFEFARFEPETDIPVFLSYDDMTEQQKAAFDSRQGIRPSDRARIAQKLQTPKPMTYGHGLAMMLIAGQQMGLPTVLVDEAKRHLEGGAIHPITAKAIEDEAVRANDLVRHDEELIARANQIVQQLKVQYGFLAA
jgi:hypothetical protein